MMNTFLIVILIFLLLLLDVIKSEENNKNKPIKPLNEYSPNPLSTLSNMTKWIPNKGKYDIFASNLETSMNKNILESNNIKAVINLSCNNYNPIVENHLDIPIYDVPSENIMQYFELCYKFIESNIKKGNILIHCQMGISRSITIIASYIMEKYKLTYEDTISNMKKCRKYINPNTGFVEQLKLYKKKYKAE